MLDTLSKLCVSFAMDTKLPKIEKGVPLTPRRSKANGLNAALLKMNVGDSILVEETNLTRNGFYTTASRIGMKIAVRRDGNKLRIWRTK